MRFSEGDRSVEVIRGPGKIQLKLSKSLASNFHLLREHERCNIALFKHLFKIFSTGPQNSN
jgi:hypothetical protein